MTSSFEPEPTGARRGLAKLRGDVGVPPRAADPLPLLDPEPPRGSEVLEQPPVGRVTLTKPRAEPGLAGQPVIGSTRRRPTRGLVVTLAALVVAIAVLLPLVLVNPFDSATSSSSAAAGSGGTPDQRLAVVRSARQFTVSFFTYDYRKINDYFQRIEAASSGTFRQDFVSKEATLKTVVTQLKTVATGQIPDAGAGLFQLAGDKATVLIAANFNASNAVTKDGQKRYRVKLVLQLVKGNWLVTNFDQVV